VPLLPELFFSRHLEPARSSIEVQEWHGIIILKRKRCRDLILVLLVPSFLLLHFSLYLHKQSNKCCHLLTLICLIKTTQCAIITIISQLAYPHTISHVGYGLRKQMVWVGQNHISPFQIPYIPYVIGIYRINKYSIYAEE